MIYIIPYIANLISNDLAEWGAFGAAIIGFIGLGALFASTVAARVNLKRDIEVVREQLNQHENRDGKLFEKLDTIQLNQNSLSERLARIEQTLSMNKLAR